MARVDGDPAKQKAAWSAAAHLGGEDLSLWCVAYPSGFQSYRNSHFNIPEWEGAGYDEAIIADYLVSRRIPTTIPTQRSSLVFRISSSTARWPRTS